MKSRLLTAGVVLLIGLATTGLEAQTSGPTPDSQNPTGNTGALKSQVQTGGSYDAHSGNATRIVNDLHVPGAVGVYGLDFTRYWNSTHNDYEDSEIEPPRGFGDSGWSHSWSWTATYEFKYPAVTYVSCGEGANQVCETDNDQYTIAINITFPDGHTTQYKTVRLGHGYWMVQGHDIQTIFQPPYSDSEKLNFAFGGLGVHDHICNMATDGSEFWLCRADGGSVHFVNMVATEVFDPHGFRTTLSWEGSDLYVEQDGGGGRFLKISYGQVSGGWVITDVVGGTGPNRTGATQSVHYEYAEPGTLRHVVYNNEDNPEGPGKVTATYDYGFCWGDATVCTESGTFSSEPLLKRADDPHYAGAMTVIRYNYRAQGCPPLESLPGDPATLTVRYPNHVTAQPYAIAEEKRQRRDRFQLFACLRIRSTPGDQWAGQFAYVLLRQHRDGARRGLRLSACPTNRLLEVS